MSWKTSLVAFLLSAAVAVAIFHLFQREIAGSWLAFGVHPQVIGELRASLADQKRLARAEPARASQFRRRFERLETLLSRLRVLDLSRDQIAQRYEILLSGLLLAVLAAAGAGHVWRQAREGRRLDRLRGALAELAAGRTDLAVGVAGRDPIGRVAAMVEEASRTMARDRRRLASLENLSVWQEAARRHAHEMRTPLAAARLELGRLDVALRAAGAAGEPALASVELAASVGEELDRLERFAHGFAAFGRVPAPALERQDLGALAADFATRFAGAWPGLDLAAHGAATADVDREMIGQVLVNLCENAALAIAGTAAAGGRVELRAGSGPAGPWLDVADDGPGVPAAIRPRLFEPYVTGRRGGSGGMGLGLAISRKILLDHGGDLELIATSERGATFRLALPPQTGPA